MYFDNAASALAELEARVAALEGALPPVEVVNVCDYGATGNGSTDDRQSILNAIAAAAGRPVYLPAGTYYCASTLVVPSGTGLTGFPTVARNSTPGDRTSINRLAGCETPTSWIKGRVDYGSDSTFTDLKIGDNNGLCGLYHADNAARTSFARCQFRGGAGTRPPNNTPVKFGESRSANHVAFTDCNFERCLGTGNTIALTEYGYLPGAGHMEYIDFTRCHLGVSNGAGGHDWGSPRAGFEAYTWHNNVYTSVHSWNHINVTDCVLEASNWFNLDFACYPLPGQTACPAGYANVTGCLIKGAGYSPVDRSFAYAVCTEAPHHVTISRNEIWCCYDEVFDIVGSGGVDTLDWIISDNNLRTNYTEDGITPHPAADYIPKVVLNGRGVFTRNTITQNAGDGIVMLRTRDSQFTDNVLIEERATIPSQGRALCVRNATNNVITGNTFRNTASAAAPRISYEGTNSGNSDISSNNVFQHA